MVYVSREPSEPSRRDASCRWITLARRLIIARWPFAGRSLPRSTDALPLVLQDRDCDFEHCDIVSRYCTTSFEPSTDRPAGLLENAASPSVRDLGDLPSRYAGIGVIVASSNQSFRGLECSQAHVARSQANDFIASE
jgi:hypothetical protein